jgi:hypothetical protein
VPKAHLLDALGNLLGLILIGRQWAASSGGTEAAITSTDIAQDHKCCSATTPTLGLIGTHTACANGMQAAPLNDLLHLSRISRATQANFEPVRLTQMLVMFFYLRHFKVHFFPIDAKVQIISIIPKLFDYFFNNSTFPNNYLTDYYQTMISYRPSILKISHLCLDKFRTLAHKTHTLFLRKMGLEHNEHSVAKIAISHLDGRRNRCRSIFFEKKLNFPPFSHLLHPKLDLSALIISSLYYTDKRITDQKPFVIYSKKRYISYNLAVILLTISKIYTGINIFNLQH